MIPRRITLEGFLCYRDEQVIDLDGSDLWVFAGRNGSGKSSVFDAMTFALFGDHRAGHNQNAACLINRDSDGLRVVFDFDLGGRTYRVHRSLRRGGRVERQLYVHDPSPDAPNPWPAVPEANGRGGFDAWVAQHIGLTVETFTSSVMLRQGEAEKLLSRRNTERFEILKGVVGIADYERLHQAADGRRKRLDADARSYRVQLGDLRNVGEAELEAAARAAEQAEGARTSADAAARRIEGLRRGAERWTELEADRVGAERRLAEGRSLLADAEGIRRDLGRLRELEAVLPKLAEGMDLRGQVAAIRRDALARDEEGAALRRRADQMTTLLDEVEGHLAGLREEIDRDRCRLARVIGRLGQLAGPLAQARLAESQREAVDRLEREAVGFPEDLEGALAGVEAALHEATEARRALPLLEQLAEHRDRLVEARGHAEATREALGSAEAEVARLEAERTDLAAASESARAAAQEARDGATKSRALADEARDRLRRFEGLEGAKTCDRCGQDLDARHFDEERRRLRGDADRTARMASESERRWHEDEAKADRLGEASGELAGKVKAAERIARDLQSDLAGAGRDVRAHAESCDQAYRSLPDAFRILVGPAEPEDWAATSYPADPDVSALRGLCDGIDDLTRRRDGLRADRDRARDVRSRLEQARRSLDPLGGAGDLTALQAEHDALQGEKAALDRCLEGHALQEAFDGSARDQLVEATRRLQRRQAELELEARAGEARIAILGESLGRARSGLPAAWEVPFESASPAEIDAWGGELARLREGGVEARAEALAVAGERIDSALRDLERIGAQQEAIAVEARCHPADLDAPLAEARGRLSQAEGAHRERQAEQIRLQGEFERRRDLQRRLTEFEGELAVAETLARLLGRDGLQRALLREAERGILDCANPILGEISGGELELRPLGDASDPEHALELEAVERIGGRSTAIPVGNLSGSQRFRVAVSLALGIGQYARGSAGAIQSVIIDEGFGCLDRFSRQDMIRELNELRGRLAKIVLVSHQEEFFDAFSDVIQFERSEQTDGTTVVTTLHR